MTACCLKPAAEIPEYDVGRPTAILPQARAVGLYLATNDDVAYLWREAQAYFDRAHQAGDAPAAARLRRLGTNFAMMAVSLLQEIGRAVQQVDRPAAVDRT